MSELIKRVGKRLEERLDEEFPIVPGFGEVLAIMAFEEIREPTQDILDCRPPFMSVDDARAMWRTMIDVASGRMK